MREAEFNPYSACEQLADFYDKLNIQPKRQTVGFLGGKTYTWYVQENGLPQPSQIYCHCSMLTLGHGKLRIESSNYYFKHWYRLQGITILNGMMNVYGPLNISKHTIKLPIPASPNQNISDTSSS